MINKKMFFLLLPEPVQTIVVKTHGKYDLIIHFKCGNNFVVVFLFI